MSDHNAADEAARLSSNGDARDHGAVAGPSPRLLDAEIERAQAAEARLAVQLALLDERLLRMEHNRFLSAWRTWVGRVVNWRRALRSDAYRRREETNAGRKDYPIWLAREEFELRDAQATAAPSSSWAFRPLISIVMAAGHPEDEILTLRSVVAQSYTQWELCVATASVPSAVQAGVEPERIRSADVAADNRPAALSNAGANAARGEYLFFVEPGDTLSPFSCLFFVEAMQGRRPALVYSDEDLERAGSRVQPEFKPDWSPRLLRSCMYIGRGFVIAKRTFEACGGADLSAGEHWRRRLLLNFSDTALPCVRHLPRVLYHRRMTDDDRRDEPAFSAHGYDVFPRGNTGSDVAVIICSRSADLLANCLRTLNSTAGAVVREVFVVAHEQTGPDERLRRVITSAGGVAIPYVGPFNFARMNNLAAASVRSRHLLFLNDDVTAARPGWLEGMLSQLADEEVGVAGATLRYPSGDIQHAGIVSGSGDGVSHVGRYMRSSVLWPWLLHTREVSAVTGACLSIRTNLFRDLGGFDTDFPNNFNDVDLCFRVRATGRAIVCVATPGLVHAECATRQGIVHFEERYRFFNRWSSLLSSTDPYYSPNLCAAETIQLNLTGAAGWPALLRSPAELSGTSAEPGQPRSDSGRRTGDGAA